MNADHWHRIEALFKQILDKSPAERTALLQSTNHSEPQIAAAVNRLLEAEEQAGDFIEQAISDGAALFEEKERITESLDGSTIGAYRLISELGRGGTSVVYQAVRADASFQRQVAVKLIRRGMDTEETRRRFHIERQILARLDHPNIASVYDGSTTEDGLPYYVMEYIEGMPIDLWCDHHKLSINRRLDLFVKVCRAVHYAHRNLVVHRDLKPSNVLVTREGEPKLLDFGIAKLLNHAPSDARTGPFLPMTPGFASPEQVRGESITTATDVYSLGVLLYLLLTGHKPYSFEDGNPSHILKVVCETEPPRPSAVVSQIGQDSERAPETVSRLRATQPEQLRRRLQGDLDNIILRTLSKEPERRYGSAGQLADDLVHFRGGRPVTARKQTLGYVTRKYIRRHWLGTGFTAVIVLMLLAFIVSTYRGSARTARERDRAEQVSSLLVDLFEITDGGEARGNTITGRELLDRGASKVRDELAAHPDTQATLLATLGQLYVKMGIYDQAELMYRDSLALQEKQPRTATDYPRHVRALGVVLAMKGDFVGAEQMFRSSLTLNLARYGEDHTSVAKDLNNLALANHDLGNYQAASALYSRAVALAVRLYGKDHPGTIIARSNLALLLYDSAQYHRAERILRRILATQIKQQPPDQEGIAETQKLLGMTLQAQGEFQKAQSVLREALSGRLTIFGEDHREVAATMNSLGAVLREMGSHGEAEALLVQALEMRLRHLGATHAELASSFEELAALYLDCGDSELALHYYHRALENYDVNFTDRHPLMGRALAGLGLTYFQLGHFEAADQYLLAGMTLLPADHWVIAETERALGDCLRLQKDYVTARALLASSLEATTVRLGANHTLTLECRAMLATLPNTVEAP